MGPLTSASLQEAFETFIEAYPTFRDTAVLDDLRGREFGRLDEQGHTYLDYTGGGLYAASHVQRHSSRLIAGVYGNPHSNNPTSGVSTALIDACRCHVLQFFNASPDEYGVVFTANASHALKLVGESYPFRPGDQFLLTFDNHNSVNGIREFDRARGAQTVYIPVRPPDMRVDQAALDRCLATGSRRANNLFAYPAQSNFSGVQHPLEWIDQAHEADWDVLLDAAAFVPTNRLDLSRWHPDYVALSFYKMFGYPTGVGALLARWPALEKLHRPWFSGGTISVASVQADDHHLVPGAAAFEDGTLDYLNIPAVDIGLELLESVGMDVLHERVRCLAGWLVERLSALQHANGRALARLYGPVSLDGRGGTVAFNFYDVAGDAIEHEKVEARAAERRISLRTGCFCNPGAGEVALGLAEEELARCFSGTGGRMDREDLLRCVNADSSGAVRVSLGLASNFADAHRFVEFAQGFLR